MDKNEMAYEDEIGNNYFGKFMIYCKSKFDM